MRETSWWWRRVLPVHDENVTSAAQHLSRLIVFFSLVVELQNYIKSHEWQNNAYDSRSFPQKTWCRCSACKWRMLKYLSSGPWENGEIRTEMYKHTQRLTIIAPDTIISPPGRIHKSRCEVQKVEGHLMYVTHTSHSSRYHTLLSLCSSISCCGQIIDSWAEQKFKVLLVVQCHLLCCVFSISYHIFLRGLELKDPTAREILDSFCHWC